MRERALELLRVALSNPEAKFRDGQWECIDGILRNRRLLVVQKTGWGKSMVYFLGTRLLRDRGKGPTLLISPLLSLMRNQIEAAQRIGVVAGTINSTNRDDWTAVKDRLLANEVDILLVSPERLANDEFRNSVLQEVSNRIGLFVVDEAHCISDWGHEFRPDYRRIAGILHALPGNIPILATTATANDRVARDIARQLGALTIERGPLMRDTLALQNIHLPSPASRMAWLAEHLKDLPGSGIIYTLTIADAERLTEWLKANGYNVEAYHSKVDPNASEQQGSDTNRRELLEHALLRNKVKALVATVALGMGFDKPDLGFVVHFQRPGSVVHYYQQVGRAGRAVDHAYGILLGGEEDEEITRYFIRNAFPPQAHVDKILGALNAADDGLSIPKLQKLVNISYGDIQKCLTLLSVEYPSPVVKIKSSWHATPVNFKMDRDSIQSLCEVRESEQQQMLRYMVTKECLMAYLGKALDDQKVHNCGKCANCLERDLVPTSVNPDLANRAAIYLRRSYQTIEPRKRWPLTDMFEHYPFKGIVIANEIVAEFGRALSQWGDDGWGNMVREDKYKAQRFRDELVEGCVQMLGAWNPSPAPAWVCCVPSLLREELVPDIARRLASRLGLPFVPALRKIRNNEPQKLMQNSYQQARNLDGVFEVDKTGMPAGPALLVDDIVDSRWTFTVTAALLRLAGCPAVLPLALAVNSHRAE